ncbi:hypothetical protein ACLB2K_024896 [Fragaria x ananassa]
MGIEDGKRIRKPKEENHDMPKSIPVLPWMRTPIEVSALDEKPLSLLPRLDPRLKEALEKMRISSLYPVQVAVWEETIGPGGFLRDLCVNSPTGSGKTLAYALPIVQALSTRNVKCLRALVVLPTHDLALQVKDVFSAIAPAVGLSVGLAVGQSSIANEISELIDKPKLEFGVSFDQENCVPQLRSAVDILVATPGRLMDHINNTKGFTLEHLCYLVVDETDRLLREAYQNWLPTVLQLTHFDDDDGLFPRAQNFQPSAFGSFRTIRRSGLERGFRGEPYPRLVKMVLSATLTQDPSKLAQLDLHHPLFLTTGEMRYRLPETLKSYTVFCEAKYKPLYLVALLQSLGDEKSIVFTSSVESTHRLCTLLNFFDELPFKIKEYSRVQRHRSKTLEAFRKGKIQVLVSTDAMTRGMDVEGVKNVINYDMPAYIKTYVHRAGRTARAGQTGCCYSLFREKEVQRFYKMLRKAENNFCSKYSIPSNYIEPLHGVYESAKEKLKEVVEMESSKKRQVGSKFPRVTKGKETQSAKESDH